MRSGDNVAYYCLKHLWLINAYGILTYFTVYANWMPTFPNSTHFSNMLHFQASLCLLHGKLFCILFQSWVKTLGRYNQSRKNCSVIIFNSISILKCEIILSALYFTIPSALCSVVYCNFANVVDNLGILCVCGNMLFWSWLF